MAPNQRTALIAALLPRAVITHERWDDPNGITLFPSELQLIKGASSTRRIEFTTGRHCAHVALAQLSGEARPVLARDRGEPLWPSGTVGSITHCRGYRAAAVASQDASASIGIDAEPHLPLPAHLEPLVATLDEQRHLAVLARKNRNIAWDRLLFSCKETVYKVWFPLTHQNLGFHQASISIDAAAHTFTVNLLEQKRTNCENATLLSQMAGTWSIQNDVILTAVALSPGFERERPGHWPG